MNGSMIIEDYPLMVLPKLACAVGRQTRLALGWMHRHLTGWVMVEKEACNPRAEV